MIALVLFVWAARLFLLCRREEAVGLDTTKAYHDRDELAERLERYAGRVGLVALVLLAVGLLLYVVAAAASDGAGAALELCREVDFGAGDGGETVRRCLAYADSAAHAGGLANVGAVLLWVALAL